MEQQQSPSQTSRRAAAPESSELAAIASRTTAPQPTTAPAAVAQAVEPVQPAAEAEDQTHKDNTPEQHHQQPVPRRLSKAQLLANRQNALKSTGPTSASGKAKVALNSVTTGLTARKVLLPSEDAAIYQAHVNRHFAECAPATEKEKTLVQLIADNEWRLLRVAPLEASVIAIGHTTCAELVAEEPDPANRDALLQGHIFLTYRKELGNISLQERRLRNQLAQDTAALEALQTERLEKQARHAHAQQCEIQRAAILLDDAQRKNIVVNDLAEFGFAFSIAELQAYQSKNAPYYRLTRCRNLDFDKFLADYRAQKEAKSA